MKLDFSKCGYDDSFSLDENGMINDSFNGAYGYKVFYNIPISYIKDSGFFTEDQMLGDDFAVCGGQLEFCVDKDGNQTGDTLLWLSVEDFDGNGIENTEFVYYDEDISELVEDFKNLNLDQER